MMKRQLSIKAKVTYAFIFLILLPTALLCGYFFDQTQKHLTQQTINTSKMVLSQLQSNVTSKINIVESVSDSIAYNSRLQSFLADPFQPGGDSINAYAREIVPLVKYGTYYNTVLIQYIRLDVSLYLTNYTIPEGFDSIWHDTYIQKEKWYQDFLRSGKNSLWYRSDSNSKQGSSAVKYTYIQKIHNTNGQYLGLTSIEVLQKDLYSFLSESPDGTDAFVFDPAKGLFLQQKKTDDSIKQERITNIRSDTGGSFQKNGEVVVYEPLTSLGTIIGIAVPKASVTSSQLLGTTMAIIGISALSLLLFYTVIKQVFRLIKRNILTMTESIESGFQPLPSPKRQDEFGVITEKFNILLSKINLLMKEGIQREVVHKDVQLKALQYQINPHFIYNTIDIFSARMELAGQYEVSEAFSDFGKILRYKIEGDSKFAMLGYEIDHLKRYVNLQQMKYGDRLQMNIQVPSSLNTCRMIKFILQPLVENSVKHGFGSRDTLTVIIEASLLENAALQIAVWDDGIGISADRLAEMNRMFDQQQQSGTWEHSEHIGLKNINERLCLFYGVQYRLVMESTEGRYTKATVTIPIQEEELRDV
ncbi:sensor histidine kinase [Paenibacillus herberti]|uniref:Histidine kinase/HSP90-like ATPase domain-containing protein n=1 Tax=Paenibacillus herberti TaxID=1619309 RepID=A0A229P4X4_9BACL|nr:sensor histidine kinase [Paenibacillus herberti]OXM16975.1 hypothetical protein CGZ75_10180 [Paenibacillus herberti]